MGSTTLCICYNIVSVQSSWDQSLVVFILPEIRSSPDRHSPRCHMYITSEQGQRLGQAREWARALGMGLRLELGPCWVSQDCHWACLPCFVAIYECSAISFIAASGEKSSRTSGKLHIVYCILCTASDKIGLSESVDELGRPRHVVIDAIGRSFVSQFARQFDGPSPAQSMQKCLLEVSCLSQQRGRFDQQEKQTTKRVVIAFFSHFFIFQTLKQSFLVFRMIYNNIIIRFNQLQILDSHFTLICATSASASAVDIDELYQFCVFYIIFY